MNRLVYIASPLSGDVAQNLDFARKACRYAIAQGVTPFAPHLLYTQLLDDNDPAERQAGMEMGLIILFRCDELWVFGPHISSGMQAEIAEAERMRIPVRRIELEEKLSAERTAGPDVCTGQGPVQLLPQ